MGGQCDLKKLQFCSPMLARLLGKFSDGTLTLSSTIDPDSGRETVGARVVLTHEGPKKTVGGVTVTRHPLPVALNFCPWCGGRLEAEASVCASSAPDTRLPILKTLDEMRDRMLEHVQLLDEMEAAGLPEVLDQDARDLHRLIREHGKDYEGGPHGDMTLPLTRSLHRLVLAAADNIKPE